MSTKNSECWATDASARAIRIELEDGKTFLLRHDHLLYAEFQTQDNGQNLHIFFTTHEVQIRGHCLRRVETALQRMELSYLASATTIDHTTNPDNHPTITKIQVAEIASAIGEASD